MKFSLFLIFVFSINLFGYEDSDMDGVEDGRDRCPDTMITDLVDENGCTVRSLGNPSHYDLIMGIGYSQVNYAANAQEDTLTTAVQVDYYNNSFSAMVISSYYSSESDKGMNDTLITAYYEMPLNDRLSLKMGGGIVLPTYSTGYGNEAIDYSGSLNLTYLLNDDFNVMGGYSYTFVNDKNVAGKLAYQDTQAYFLGINYMPDEQWLFGLAYHTSDSIYRDIAAIEKLSLYGMLRLDQHWFGSLGYAYGLSDSTSDHALDLRLGYFF